MADLPRLATKTFAIWVPALLMIVVFIVFETSGAEIGNQSVPSIAFNLFIFPPPLAVTFLAGILADRSSYLAGGIAGLLSGILFSIYVMTELPGRPRPGQRRRPGPDSPCTPCSFRP